MPAAPHHQQQQHHWTSAGLLLLCAALAMACLGTISLMGVMQETEGSVHGVDTWRERFKTTSQRPHRNQEDPLLLPRIRTYHESMHVYDVNAGAMLNRIEALENSTAAREKQPAAIRSTSEESRGKLTCDGESVHHEIIYWKDIPSDREYVAPTASRRKELFMTFEYDQGGWNNVRMGVECLVVMAHAMGRTLVVPPAQNLYLLGAPVEGKKKKLGFSDFFDLEAIGAHRGLPVMSMETFLSKVGAKSTTMWGKELWKYLKSRADVQPSWNGALVALPRSYDSAYSNISGRDKTMLQRYAGGRRVAYLDEATREAKHMHVPATGKHRILQHHYSFAFFADPAQRAFYRRLIRDAMRYIDPIQCAGAKLVDAVREKSRALGLSARGDYYALHIRRGDFQFKDVKLSADKIVENLRGNEIIPKGSLVFVATDDPEGKCEHCRSGGAPCPKPEDIGAKTQADMPKGCPLDPSWDAFWRNGWILVFSRNFTAVHTSNVAGALHGGINPNYLGMAESIVCSRANAFAGTWFSTFTGYIHRLRGFHGLGEHTYYHSTGRVDAPRSKESYGRGYAREYRIGWTDDARA